MSYERAYVGRIKAALKESLDAEISRLTDERDFLKVVYDRISGTTRLEQSSSDLTALQMQSDLGGLFP